MSNRILVFGRSELSFLCSTSHYMSLPAELGPSHYCYHRYFNLWTPDNAQEAYSQWLEIVCDYSARNGYTRKSDILPALSGIAAHFQKSLCLQHDDYVAGLWREDLRRGVVWMMRGDKLRFPPTLSALLQTLGSGDYLAPSWSWVDRGRVEFESQYHGAQLPRSECSMHVSTTPKGENRLGEIVTARLHVTGKVLPLPSDMERQPLESTYREFRPSMLQLSRTDDHRWWIYMDWVPESNNQPAGKLKMVVTG